MSRRTYQFYIDMDVTENTRHDTGRKDRRFLRHPTTLVMECQSHGHPDAAQGVLQEVSLGGASFVSDKLFAEGDHLDMTFPGKMLAATFGVVVVWSRDLDPLEGIRCAYGVRFRDSEVLPRVRLLEQICRIEAYRETQAAQCHRHLTSNQAAAEWIDRYADR